MHERSGCSHTNLETVCAKSDGSGIDVVTGDLSKSGDSDVMRDKSKGKLWQSNS